MSAINHPAMTPRSSVNANPSDVDNSAIARIFSGMPGWPNNGAFRIPQAHTAAPIKLPVMSKLQSRNV